MRIRSYRGEDIDIIKAITVEAFKGVAIDENIERQFGVIGGYDWQWRKSRHIDMDVERDPKGIFVAEIEDIIVGYISTWCDKEAGIGHIPNLAVRAGYRGQQIGRQLIVYACEYFQNGGLRYAKIETLNQNDIGNHVYRDQGFIEVATQIHFVKPL